MKMDKKVNHGNTLDKDSIESKSDEMIEEKNKRTGNSTEGEEYKELRQIIEESVESSVNRAFKKHRRFRFPAPRIGSIIKLAAALVAVIGFVVWFQGKQDINKRVDPIEGHDLTLENDGIFGFTVADFEEPILGESTRQKVLIVEEQEIYVNTTLTDTGFLNWGIFNKEQAITIHGTGQYTIDLAQVTAEDISLNEETYEVTISIPHASLHETIFDPSKTEVGDTEKGWLAFGDISLNMEQATEFEIEAKEKLEEKLNEQKRFEEADRFAKLSAYELYQPIVRTVSPAYKVVIEFQ